MTSFQACSPYFKAMFPGDLIQSQQIEITIRDIDYCAMDLLINYCYTSRIIVDEQNVQILLPAASILRVKISPMKFISIKQLFFNLD